MLDRTSQEEGRTEAEIGSKDHRTVQATGGRSAVPLILVLNTPGVSQVELQDLKGTCLTNRHTVPVRDIEFEKYPNSPLKKSENGSALEAFLEYARRKENGFTEVHA